VNDKYLQYQLEDFLTDDLFVEWAKKNQNAEEWKIWIEKNPASKDSISEARTMVLNLKFRNRENLTPFKKETWSRIIKSTEAKEISINTSRRRWIYPVVAAAVITLLCVIFIPQNSTVYKTTELAQVITLPANSVVEVKQSSQITYKNSKWDESRVVELQGYAHFEVSKGVPFKVQTSNGEVEVLGTQFDVVSNDKTFYVKVEEGRVSASSGNNNEVLGANMSFYKNPVWSGPYSMTEEWKADRIIFAFKDQPLPQVLKTIPYYFNYSINDKTISEDVRYTGGFDTSEGLETALQKLLWPLNISYKIENNNIVISQG